MRVVIFMGWHLMRCLSGIAVAIGFTASPMAVNAQGPVEPVTRSLSPAEAQAQLESEWLFQAGTTPLRQQAKTEIVLAAKLIEHRKTHGGADAIADETREMSDLGRKLDALPAAAIDETKALYLKIRALKRQIFFKDPAVSFDKLIFIDAPERYPHESMHRVYPQAQLNCGRLLMLDGLHPGGQLRRIAPELGAGWFWRPDISFDGKRILFCFRPAADRTFHLYEINVDGTGLRQITAGNYDDQDPVYLPDGRIVFMSNRGNSYARCTVGHPSTLLTRCDADGKNIYILSAGNEPEYTPALLPDGRILYTRWEYTDKELMRIQSLWTVNPDGTGTTVFWGNQSYWPDLLMEARAIPGDGRVMFAGHGHHQVYWGSLGIIDYRKGINYPDGLTKVTLDTPWPEVGNGPGEQAESKSYQAAGNYRGYKSPYPLSPELFLVSARHGKPDTTPFRLYLMDIHGNRELIYQGAYNLLYPIPVQARPTPPVIPDQTSWAGAQQERGPVKPGAFYSANIYEGTPKQLHGKAKFLRIISQEAMTFTLGKKLQDVEHPQGHPHLHVGPVMSLAVNDSFKYVLGTVPVEPDGSVYFEVPPCKALFFQLLDARHRTLQTMRSFTNLMPGERRGCVGCHEMHTGSPRPVAGIANKKSPQKPVPYPWGADYTLAYERDIQPILDKNCGACHQGKGKGKETLDLTLRPSSDFGTFPEPYVTLTLGKKRKRAGDFVGSAEGGIAGTILAQVLPWKPETYKTIPAMTKLSYTSRLVEIAGSGKHHNVMVDDTSLMKLTVWVDLLCPYRGEKEAREMADPDPEHPLFKHSNYPPSDAETVKDVYAQSPYRPRMCTAPLVNRAYRQDEFPSVESRLPRDADGKIIPPVHFTKEGERVQSGQPSYPDHRPAAQLRLEAQDAGVVLRHGDGPGECDYLGARDVWVYESGGTYYMHYDGAGRKGWLACLATSNDLVHWVKKGPVLDFGAKSENDSASAAYGVTYFDGSIWHMFYLGTPHASPAPNRVPALPYLTMKAKSQSPGGPWVKQKDVIPFQIKPGTYYAKTASPGHVVRQGDEYLMFFSASMKRTIGIARTRNLDGPWTIDSAPIVPPEEQIENSSLYFEPVNQTWFLFTNHIGLERHEYTDAVWVYWTKDLNHWDATSKAVVLDGKNCTWSRKCIGLPSVVKVGSRLAMFYDAPGGESKSHMKRDVGLAWLELPLVPPAKLNP